MEQFPSYVRKLWARLTDLMLLTLGLTALTAGVLVVANEHVETWGWVVVLPACIFLGRVLLGAPQRRSK